MYKPKIQIRRNYELELEIPELPKTINQLLYTHWAVKNSHAKTWKTLILYATVGKRPLEPLTKARLTLTRCSAKEPDFDGLVSSFKHVVDALIFSKIIIDDSTKHVGIPTYVWEKAKPKEGKIRIKVEEL